MAAWDLNACKHPQKCRCLCSTRECCGNSGHSQSCSPRRCPVPLLNRSAVSSGVRRSTARLLTLPAALPLLSLMMISEHGDNYHDGESDIDRHVSNTCSPMCRLGAFWYEETACAARLGCVELRRNASVEERRAGAAMLRAFLHLVKRLQASQAELKAALDAQTSQASAQPARPLPDAALFRAGIPHVLVSDGRCRSPQSLSFFRLTCYFSSAACRKSLRYSRSQIIRVAWPFG